jgi:CDP-diacylglycerol--glycerol-3-phosphate 3-phosphatidyltransferase
VLSSKARDTFRHVTEPAGHALAKAGITANSLTAIGLAGSLGAGALIATGQPVIGGAVSLLSGLPDMLDGAVAKASGRSSRRGAFLDSVVDRLSDAAVLAGLIWYAAIRDLDAMAMLAALVLGLSLIVSYIKARAESLGFACNVGITVVQRILVVWQQSNPGPDIGR